MLVYVDPQLLGPGRQQHRGRRLRRDLGSLSGEHPAGPGLRLAVLHRRILHPEESRGGRMRPPPTRPRRSSTASIIVVPLRGDVSPTRLARPGEGDRDLGEATIGQIDTGSFMLKLFLLGGFRGIVANVPLDPGRGPQEAPRLGPAQGHRRPDHQAPAPLPLDLDVPGLEPGLQRLGRMGRPGRQVRVDQAGDQVRPGRRGEQPAARPT